ncbi:Atu2307/SP_0267 family LLM class monooxygenase [Pseudonocardia sp.]|uniref:Atu2307/SP_0267 family LLM class monooxygenase n=1 Tax=Pseudonocardia sp. TaxID=60912 RepID=UPI003D0D4FF2
MEIGVTTFADASHDVAPAQRLRETVEQIALADQVGLDMFGVGEHHRADYLASAPAMVLAAGAERSSRIRLSSAVTVLSSDDPVRVFQNFATLDLLSGGRAEIMAGRGSFVESFPLFGHDLADYDELFAEKLDLLLALRRDPRVTWSGRHRAALADQPVFPRPVQDPLPVWVAVGGNPQSAVRAGTLGLPMALAIIGGAPDRFVAFAELFRRSLAAAGHDPATPLSLNMHGFVADTDAAAADTYFPPHSRVMNRIGRERGWSPTGRAAFDAATTLPGPYVVGGPERVAEKMLHHHELFGHARIALQLAIGDIAHADVMRAIELLGTEVAPLVRDEVARRRATPAPAV